MQCARLVGRLRQQLRGAGAHVHHFWVEVIRQAGQGTRVLDGNREIAQTVRQALCDGLPARPHPALREVIEPGVIEAPAGADDCLEAVISRPQHPPDLLALALIPRLYRLVQPRTLTTTQLDGRRVEPVVYAAEHRPHQQHPD